MRLTRSCFLAGLLTLSTLSSASAADSSAATARYSKGSDDSGSDDKGGSSNSGSGSNSGSTSSSNSGSGSSSSGNSGSATTTNSGPSSKSSETETETASGSKSNGTQAQTGDDKGGAAVKAATASSEVVLQGKAKAQFAGFPAEFSVKFEQRFDRTRFQAEVSNLNVNAGTVLGVCNGTSLLGNVTVSALKLGELELDSRKGDPVPVFAGGEEIALRSGGCSAPVVMKVTLGGSSSFVAQSDSLIEGSARKLIQGFEAEFHVRLEHRADRDKFTAEAEGLNLGSGTRLDVCFQGNGLGDLFLNTLNSGELELDSRFGAPAIPALKTGDVVELRRGGCAGELILAATMGTTSSTAPAGQALRTVWSGETKKVIDTFEAEFSAKFEQIGDRKKASAEASNANLPQGTHLTVCLAGGSIGDIVLNSTHFGELELDTRNGDLVPAVNAGDLVELHRQGCSSELLMSVKLALVP